MVEFCINHIIKHISSTKNVCEIFVSACLSNYPTLRDALSNYIDENFYAVLRSKEFLVLPYEQLKMVMKKHQTGNRDPLVLQYEELLLDFIMRWTLHSRQDRRRYFQELISSINFEKIPQHYLEVLSIKYRVNCDRYDDLKTCLTAFFESDTIEASAVLCKNPFKNLALHVYIEYEIDDENNHGTLTDVFSISRCQSKWSSIQLENCKAPPYYSSDFEGGIIIGLDEPCT